MFEALGFGVLDMECMSSVAREKWFISYKRLLGEERDLIKFEGVPRKAFRFGDRQSLPSLGTHVIPAWKAYTRPSPWLEEVCTRSSPRLGE